MGEAGPWEKAFWYVSVLLKAGLLGRLAWLRLLREYPALSVFLALQLIRTLWLLPYSTISNEYSFRWVFTEPLLIISRVLVVFELYGKILASYRGLSIASRSTMAAVLAASLGLSVAAHFSEYTQHGDISSRLKAVSLFDTTVSTAMLFFILALAAFMYWFPARVRRNLLVHCCSFSAYFVVTSTAIYLRGLNVTEWARTASASRILASDIIMALWIVLITKRGEDDSSDISRRLAPDTQDRLLKQLDELNRTLESRHK